MDSRFHGNDNYAICHSRPHENGESGNPKELIRLTIISINRKVINMADNERDDKPNRLFVLPVPFEGKKEDGLLELPQELGILSLRNIVVYPHMVAPLMAGKPQALQLLDDVNKTNGLIAMVTQQRQDVDDPKPDDLFTVGTVGKIIKQLQFPNNIVQIWVHGIARVKIIEYVETDKPYMVAKVEVLHETD